MVRLTRGSFSSAEAAAVQRVLDSGHTSMGREVAALEEEWAARCGTKWAVAVSSATAGLQLCAEGMGELFWVPSLTFVGAVDAIARRPWNGFFDIASVTDPAPRYFSYPCSIQVLHYAGRPAPEWHTEHGYGLPTVLEDCAHCYPGQPGIGWGAAQVFSLHGTKNLTCGEGGIVTTDRDDVAEYVRLARRHGIEAPGRRPGMYDVKCRGWNYAMSDLAAAVARCQLARVDEFTDRRLTALACYRMRLPVMASGSGHIAVMLCDNRDEVRAHLAAAGIETSIHYPPVHRMSTYATGDHLPNTDAFARRCLTLPLHADMTLDDVAAVCEAVEEVVDG